MDRFNKPIWCKWKKTFYHDRKGKSFKPRKEKKNSSSPVVLNRKEQICGFCIK